MARVVSSWLAWGLVLSGAAMGASVPFSQRVMMTDSTSTNIASVTASNAVKVDGSAVTQPVSAAALPTFSDKSGSGTIGALNGTLAVTVNGMSTVAFNITGTWSATLASQGTTDGTNWFSIPLILPISATANAVAANTPVLIPCGGYQEIRFIASAYTSGTATLAWNEGSGAQLFQAYNFVASNFAATVNNITGTVSLPTGASTSALQTSGNASLSSIDAGIPAGLGQTTMSASMPVAIASDQSPLSTKVPLTANSPANVSVGVTSASCLASNTSRRGAIFTNVSINKISMGIGVAAVLNSGITLYPGGTWTMDEFNFTTAAVNCIASAAASGLGVQEFQP